MANPRPSVKHLPESAFAAVDFSAFETLPIIGNGKANAAIEKQNLLLAITEKERRMRERKITTRYYQDTGPLRRELYRKHLEFFRLGKAYRERLCLAANRVGKTEGLGLYELVTHCTGWYPDWWDGRVFDKPVSTWACGDTGETVREILQEKLLGRPGEWGTGLIPAESIIKVNRAGGNVPDSVESILIRHRPTGGASVILFKAYEQRRKAFQGTEQDVILLDEEPSLGIYIECLMRTMTNNGMMMLTFTPLLGMSEVVMQFLPDGRLDYYDSPFPDAAHASKIVIMLGWDDAPHLTEDAKRELEASIPAYQRDARTKGIPQLGAGAIYAVPESEIIIPDFPIPKHWPKAYALDVGWNKTAAVWGATDEASGVSYLYSEHYRGQAEPSVHAESIRARGIWIPGVIDPAARGRSQKDGQRLIANYRDLGLNLHYANNAVEAGIFAVWQALSEGTLKVFGSLKNWAAEYRLYRRNEKGEIVKQNDHLMDATRYYKMSGESRACIQPVANSERGGNVVPMYGHDNGWMA